MNRIGQELDLQSALNTKGLSNAMLRCQGWAPACADIGMCQQNGSCFSSKIDCAASRKVFDWLKLGSLALVQ